MSTLALSSSDEDADKAEQALKVVVLGDSNVGKTAICCRFAQHVYPQKYQQTAGVDFFSRRTTMPRNTTVLLQLWDVGGHNLASPSMLNTYIFGAQAVLFVYDVTSSQSFENLADWVSAAKKISSQMEKLFYMAVVGNKADLEHRRVVKVDKHNKFAEQNALHAHYVSAKTGDSIELMFKKAAAEVLGIQLTKAEQEWNISVVQAQITAVDKSHSRRQKKVESEAAQKESVAEENGEKKNKKTTKTKNSAVCCIQ